MDRFDDAMREALRRVDPPEGFAGRLTARLEAGRAEERERAPERWWNRLAPGFRGTQLRWVTALATVVVLAGGLEYHQQKVEQQASEGLRAKQEVMLALRITGSKLRLVEAKVRELNTSSMER